MMKHTITLIAALFFCFAGMAQVKMPAASPLQTIKQAFGLGEIELNYSRPSLRGREMIGLVEPWGSVWRTGANEASKITFTDEVEIDGQKIKAGTYAIYTIPNKDGNWFFILNNGVNNWGAFAYSPDANVLKMRVKAATNLPKAETLTMQFSDLTNESTNLNIRWDHYGLKIPIKTDIKSKIKASLDKALKTDKNVYYQAATYYYEYEQNYKEALNMMDKGLAEESNAPYFRLFYKARIQKDMGDKKGALATAQKTLDAAKAAKNENYIVMSTQMIQELK